MLFTRHVHFKDTESRLAQLRVSNIAPQSTRYFYSNVWYRTDNVRVSYLLHDIYMNSPLQGVTNLRSIDFHKDAITCACQSINYEEVVMDDTNPYYDTYQYHETLTDVAAYSCDVTRSSMKQESLCYQLGVGTEFTDGIIIGGYQCKCKSI